MIGGQSLLYKNPLEIQAGFCTGSVCAVLCCIGIASAIIKFFYPHRKSIDCTTLLQNVDFFCGNVYNNKYRRLGIAERQEVLCFLST